MEIELKYKVPNKETLDKIWYDKFISEIAEDGAREDVLMKAAYFDTEDRILSENDIAFRVRMEGNRIIASLKWNDKDQSISGLHVREEINVPMSDDTCFISPSPEIFKESKEGRDLLEVVGGSPLINIMEMTFVRKRIRLDNGNCICELSLDDGKMICDSGFEPISEMEIELFTGEQEELIKIGKEIAEKYNLEPENTSKYGRGINLMSKQLEYAEQER
jgi:inorganic triphosphatase YgiF